MVYTKLFELKVKHLIKTFVLFIRDYYRIKYPHKQFDNNEKDVDVSSFLEADEDTLQYRSKLKELGIDVGFRDGLSREEYIEVVQASNNGDTTIIPKKERKKYDECNKYF